MALEIPNAYLTLVNEILSTATAGVTTLTAGVALVALGTVGASSAFLALPVLAPVVLVGSVALSKLLHAGMLHTHDLRTEEEDSCLGNIETDPMTSLRNRELFSGLGLGGIAAGTAVVANNHVLYSGLGMVGGLSAGLALASLGLAINAIHDAYFAWRLYRTIKIPEPKYAPAKRAKRNAVPQNQEQINDEKKSQEVALRSMYSSIVAAFGWTAVTMGGVAAAMSLTPLLVAACFLLGGVAITGARLYNDGFNFGFFNKKAKASNLLGDPEAALSMHCLERIDIRSTQHGL
ncbi:MAG: hypothetical protein K0R24_1209 [Gammaproteobacteria bacterium]|jgi:hypothetical protein|nr:hypothetical protein [Gammaproteobacteria bacterium]